MVMRKIAIVDRLGDRDLTGVNPLETGTCGQAALDRRLVAARVRTWPWH